MEHLIDFVSTHYADVASYAVAAFGAFLYAVGIKS